MINFAKKIEKHRSSDLHPGEKIEAATFVQPVGEYGRMLGTQLGGVVGAVAAGRAAKKREAEAEEEAAGSEAPADGGLASQISVSPAVLGLSAQRMLVFGHSKLSGRPTDLDVAYSIQDVAGMTSEKKKMSATLDISFADGSTAQFEVVKPAKPGPFVEAYERLKG